MGCSPATCSMSTPRMASRSGWSVPRGWRATRRRSGKRRKANSEDGKSFWLVGSEGLARYTPALWQAPEGLTGLDLPVHAAMEDRQGRLWFAATDYLLELDGAVWKRHRIPSGLRTHTTQTASVMESPNGRVVV